MSNWNKQGNFWLATWTYDVTCVAAVQFVSRISKHLGGFSSHQSLNCRVSRDERKRGARHLDKLGIKDAIIY
jgi:hypothetical protein